MQIESFDSSSFDLKALYKKRQQEVAQFLQRQDKFCAVFEDAEHQRTQDIRYLCGMPSDAILVIFASGKSVLCPWDINLCATLSYATEIIPLTKYDCSHTKAIKAILLDNLKDVACPLQNKKPVAELSPACSYIEYNKRQIELKDFDLCCSEQGAFQKVQLMRSTKDEYEIACIKHSAYIADYLITQIEKGLKNQTLKTESDVALFIEKNLRLCGAQSTSFDTLVAGPKRSFSIHAFPAYTSGNWGGQGISILDFGVRFLGYCSDVTLSVVNAPTKEQQHLVDLVYKAAKIGLEFYVPDTPLKDASDKVNEYFKQEGYTMPHSLGHGIGLNIHETPFVRSSTQKDFTFSCGQVVTLEPGLYDVKLGGCRLENDVLLMPQGHTVITHSHIIYL